MPIGVQRRKGTTVSLNPKPVTITVSKVQCSALLLRFSYGSRAHDLAPVFIVFSLLATASIIVGNRAAPLQNKLNNVKRILALDDDSGVRAAIGLAELFHHSPKEQWRNGKIVRRSLGGA